MDTQGDIIQKNLVRVREQVAAAARASGRNPDDVKILLATKTVEPERICQAIAAGANMIGENRIQEALSKHEAVQQYIANHDAGIVERHFIGHLQSNKIKDMLGCTDVLETLDRPSLAQKLHAVLSAEERKLPVLIQVNTSGEESKSGVAVNEALDFSEQVLAMPYFSLLGYMTIGLNSDDREAVRASYRRVRDIRDAAGARFGVKLPELSMGMSGDFDLAIEEGATVVRLGSIVFGHRS